MHFLGSILALLVLVGFLAGLVSVIYPIKKLGIPTRRRALLVLGASFVLMPVAGSMLDEPAVQNTDKTVSTAAAPETTTATTPIPSSAHPEDTGNRYFVAEEKDASFGNVRSRLRIDIEAPDAQTDRAKVVTMMAAAVEHHRKHWPDVVAVRLWQSYNENDGYAQKRILYAPDGCGWTGDDCTDQLWTNEYNALIPDGLEKWGDPATGDQKVDREVICRQNLQCWGEKHIVDATVICQEMIEDWAQFDYEWTGGFWAKKFDRYRWLDRSEGSIKYLGDKVKFQNGFGAWMHLRYSCEFNPNTGHAKVDVFQ